MEEGRSSPGLIISKKKTTNPWKKKGKNKLVIFTIIEDYQCVHLGVSLGSELWHMSVNDIGRRVTKQRAKFATVH